MSRYHNADDLYDLIYDSVSAIYEDAREVKDEVLRIIAEERGADVEPVRYGHWIPHKTIVRSPFVKNYDCSECGHESFAYPNCPYCRAIMDGKERK